MTQLWQPMALIAPRGPSPEAGGNLGLGLGHLVMKEGLCLLQLRFNAGHLGRAPEARLPHSGYSAQALQAAASRLTTKAPELDRVGSRSLHAPGPAPTYSPMTAAGKNQYSSIMDLQYHERRLHHSLGSRREGLSDPERMLSTH